MDWETRRDQEKKRGDICRANEGHGVIFWEERKESS